MMIVARRRGPSSRSGSPAKALSASASRTSGTLGALDQRRARTPPSTATGPRPGPSAMTSAPQLEHPVERVQRDRARPPVSSSGSVMYSGAQRRDDRHARRGVATVTRPAPERSAPMRGQMRGAGLAARSGDDQDAAEVALVRVGGARLDRASRICSVRQQLDPRAVEAVDDACGMPMSAIDEVAREGLRRRQHQRQLRRAERHRHRRVDRRSPITSRRVGRQPARQIDRHHRTCRRR